MKKNSFIFSFVLLISCDMMAQKQDLVPARSLAEKGAQGDIILGRERKKNQLSFKPQILEAADSSRKNEVNSKKTKNKHKKI
jgi:hypothetical protein